MQQQKSSMIELQQSMKKLQIKSNQFPYQPLETKPCRHVGIDTSTEKIDIDDPNKKKSSSLSYSQLTGQVVKYYLKNVETGELIGYCLGDEVPVGWKVIKKKVKKKRML